jgi:Secretion system C-terminal sorting domain
MKKILLTLFTIINFINLFSQNEPIYLRGDFTTTPWDASLLTTQRGSGLTYTLNNLSGVREFKFGTSDWAINWGANSTPFVSQTITSNTISTYYSLGGNASFNFTSGKYYTFNLERTSNLVAVLETPTAPVSITSVTRTPATVSNPTLPVTINVTTSASPSVNEKIYVRYSTDFYNTSVITLVNMTGSNGTATIPSYSNSSTMFYYVYSSPLSKSEIDNAVALKGQTIHDVAAIKINNSCPTFENCSYSYGISYPSSFIESGQRNGSSAYYNNQYGIMNILENQPASNRHAYIYPKSVFGSFSVGADLKKMLFSRITTTSDPVGSITPGTSNFKIYLANTNNNDWGAGNLDWNTAISTATKVWDGDPASTIGDNDLSYVPFILDIPFRYAGNNLIVLVEYTQSALTAKKRINWFSNDKTTQPLYGDNQIRLMTNNVSTPGTTLSPAITTYYSSTHPRIIFEAALILPVELVTFEGKNTKKGNILSWETASEKNTKEFVLEKSSDNKTFSVVGTVKASGNSITPLTYSFLDINPSYLNYYRLKIVDFDGKVEFSKVVSIQNNKTKDGLAKVFPNPTSDFLTIESEEILEKIIVFNTLGQVVKNIQNVGNQQIKLEMDDIPNGVYFLKVNNQDLIKVNIQN